MARSTQVGGARLLRYHWTGQVGTHDDFGEEINDVFIDGRTRSAARLFGAWAIMSPQSWRIHGCGRLGQGYGQQYEKQSDGRWLKTAG